MCMYRYICIYRSIYPPICITPHPLVAHLLKFDERVVNPPKEGG